jgi:hypothetical protein
MAKPPRPTRSPDSGGKSEDRRDRLAAALRENLKKRKRQARARSRAATDTAADPTDDTAES